MYSYTRPPQQILEYDRWMLAEHPDADEWQSVEVTSARWQSQKLLAKLAGTDDRNGAEGLVGKWVAIQSAQLSPLPEGEYYWSDLAGLSVLNQDGVELGVVDHLIETGANDVLAIRSESGEQLLPWSPEVIVEVDLVGGRIRVEWHPEPDG